MPRVRLNPTGLFLLLLPGPAFAHGDISILLFPIGNVLAISATLLLAATAAIRWPVRVVAVIAAFSASVPFWFLPALPPRPAWFYFLAGVLPSLAAGTLVIRLFRGKRTKHNGA